MAQLIRFEIAGGGEVFVEARKGDSSGALVADADGMVAAPRSCEDACAQIRPIAEVVIRELSKLAVRPDEIAVELGVSLKANAGIILASVATEGSLKVTLKWKPAG